jgi:hypothetical protein
MDSTSLSITLHTALQPCTNAVRVATSARAGGSEGCRIGRVIVSVVSDLPHAASASDETSADKVSDARLHAEVTALNTTSTTPPALLLAADEAKVVFVTLSKISLASGDC